MSQKSLGFACETRDSCGIFNGNSSSSHPCNPELDSRCLTNCIYRLILLRMEESCGFGCLFNADGRYIRKQYEENKFRNNRKRHFSIKKKSPSSTPDAWTTSYRI